MKNVSIKYGITTGLDSTKIALGNCADASYRKVLDIRGNPIHTAKGRLTQAQFISRCECNNVYVYSIDVKGKKVYDHINKPIQRTKKDVFPSKKFLVSKFINHCAETSKTILKGDLMYFNKDTKLMYCEDSQAFKQALDSKVWNHQLVANFHNQ